MRIYPSLYDDSNKSLKQALDFIIRERGKDVTAWNGLPSTYIAGRKVAKIPTGSTDTVGSFPGDFNASTSYAFFCVGSTVTTQWYRTDLSTF